MKPFAAIAAALALAAALLLVPGVFSRAEEPKAPAQSTLVATIDLSPIQTELAALRAEMTALRQAVADPKGLRDEIAQTAAATKALDARLAELADLVGKRFDSLRPALAALDPSTVWEYQCLRTRSENVANRIAREGWQLVTASADWLYFRRPVVAGRKTERPPEAEKEE
ncbi:MAG: hypothetical protein FJ290_32345 [Planctomycetes bacterium]|nr:hypothetical protein [Planctomycetota bacterium]